jgi:GAF domain-containing protein
MSRPRAGKLPVLVTLDPALALDAEGRGSRTKILFDVTRRLLEAQEPAQVLLAIHESVVEHLAPERSCLLRVARDGEIQPLSSTGFNLSGPLEEWPVSQPVLRKVRETGHSVLATDVTQDAPEPLEARPPKLRLRSVLCAPLSRTPVRNLLYLDSREGRGRTYHRDDLDFLTALTVHASLILERAYALARAKQALFDKTGG